MWAEALGWLGCSSGILGATLLAANVSCSGLGWICFLISNLCWIAYAVLVGAGHIELQHIAFMATSVLGIYRWLIVKQKRTYIRKELHETADQTPP